VMSRRRTNVPRECRSDFNVSATPRLTVFDTGSRHPKKIFSETPRERWEREPSSHLLRAHRIPPPSAPTSRRPEPRCRPDRHRPSP
jgi:hypothetical protein